MQKGKEETSFFIATYIDINKQRMLIMKIYSFLPTVFLLPSDMDIQ